MRNSYDYLQVQQYTAMFEPLKMSIVKDEGIEQIVKTANEFHDKNQSFVFNIETEDGDIVYTTVNDKGITTTESHVVVTKDIATDSANRPRTLPEHRCQFPDGMRWDSWPEMYIICMKN